MARNENRTSTLTTSNTGLTSRPDAGLVGTSRGRWDADKAFSAHDASQFIGKTSKVINGEG